MGADQGLQDGTFQIFCSDHAPYSFDEKGRLAARPNPAFNEIGAGVPGIEVRIPLLFSEGVGRGRLDLQQFVALTSTNVAKLNGLFPRKGTISIGSDADFGIWDPELKVTIGVDMLHDNVGYTPYEGFKVTGWPITVVNRGRVVIRDGQLLAQRGSGHFLARGISDMPRPLGKRVPELDAWSGLTRTASRPSTGPRPG